VDGYATPSAWRLRDVPLKAALRIEPEEAFLRARLPNYAVARLVEGKTPAGSRVLAGTPPPEAYTSRDIVTGYQAALNNTLRDIAWSGVFRVFNRCGSLRSRFRARRCGRSGSSRTGRAARTSGTSPSCGSFGAAKSYGVFRRGACAHSEPLGGAIGIRQQPGHTLAELAIAVSGHVRRGGLGATEIVNSIRLECSPEQPDLRLSAWGQTTLGNWIRLAETHRESVIPVTSELKRLAAVS